MFLEMILKKKIILILSVFLFLGCRLDSTAILTGAGEKYLENKQIEGADRVVRCRKYSNGDIVCTEKRYD